MAPTNSRVGTGATLIYPDDRAPYVIIEDRGDTLVLKELHTVSKETGHKPRSFQNGYPVWDHTYTPEEIARFCPASGGVGTVVTVHQVGQDSYTDAEGLVYLIGRARYYRNYAAS